MIGCFVSGCSWKTTCPALLSLHLRRLHEPIDVYTCSELNCGRRFSVRCSFIAHIRKHLKVDENEIRSRKNRENNENELLAINSREEMESMNDFTVVNNANMIEAENAKKTRRNEE